MFCIQRRMPIQELRDRLPLLERLPKDVEFKSDIILQAVLPGSIFELYLKQEMFPRLSTKQSISTAVLKALGPLIEASPSTASSESTSSEFTTSNISPSPKSNGNSSPSLDASPELTATNPEKAIAISTALPVEVRVLRVRGAAGSMTLPGRTTNLPISEFFYSPAFSSISFRSETPIEVPFLLQLSTCNLEEPIPVITTSEETSLIRRVPATENIWPVLEAPEEISIFPQDIGDDANVNLIQSEQRAVKVNFVLNREGLEVYVDPQTKDLISQFLQKPKSWMQSTPPLFVGEYVESDSDSESDYSSGFVSEISEPNSFSSDVSNEVIAYRSRKSATEIIGPKPNYVAMVGKLRRYLSGKHKKLVTRVPLGTFQALMKETGLSVITLQAPYSEPRRLTYRLDSHDNASSSLIEELDDVYPEVPEKEEICTESFISTRSNPLLESVSLRMRVLRPSSSRENRFSFYSESKKIRTGEKRALEINDGNGEVTRPRKHFRDSSYSEFVSSEPTQSPMLLEENDVAIPAEETPTTLLNKQLILPSLRSKTAPVCEIFDSSNVIIDYFPESSVSPPSTADSTSRWSEFSQFSVTTIGTTITTPSIRGTSYTSASTRFLHDRPWNNNESDLESVRYSLLFGKFTPKEDDEESIESRTEFSIHSPIEEEPLLEEESDSTNGERVRREHSYSTSSPMVKYCPRLQYPVVLSAEEPLTTISDADSAISVRSDDDSILIHQVENIPEELEAPFVAPITKSQKSKRTGKGKRGRRLSAIPERNSEYDNDDYDGIQEMFLEKEAMVVAAETSVKVPEVKQPAPAKKAGTTRPETPAVKALRDIEQPARKKAKVFRKMAAIKEKWKTFGKKLELPWGRKNA
ncbi:hypothetical protein RUND412_001799 [Rhizina undulata]